MLLPSSHNVKTTSVIRLKGKELQRILPLFLFYICKGHKNYHFVINLFHSKLLRCISHGCIYKLIVYRKTWHITYYFVLPLQHSILKAIVLIVVKACISMQHPSFILNHDSTITCDLIHFEHSMLVLPLQKKMHNPVKNIAILL